MINRERLCEAINCGFISISVDKDGIYRYALTKAGAEQWISEDKGKKEWLKMTGLIKARGEQ